MAADVYRRTIEEAHRRLGRHVLHDPASRAYPAETAAKLESVAHLAVGLPLNQLAVGKCTCEALAGAKNAKPNYTGGHVENDGDTDALYERETANEGAPWTPGNSQNDIGGSGLEVCRAGKQLGIVRAYHHAFGVDHALRALVLRPTISGVNWYSSFDQPDETGLIEISAAARIRGGHEIAGLEIDVENEDVWFAQSWGLQYGVARPSIGLPEGGAFRMKFATYERLLAEEGDCTVPYFVS